MTLTADTITDDQIRALWRAGEISSELRNEAIRTWQHGIGNTLRHAARVRCVKIMNRHGATS